MKYGVCGGPELAGAVADAGFDFMEMTVAGLLAPREGQDAFAEALAAVEALPLSSPVVNCFVPGNMKITGPDADPDALAEFVTTTCQRARAAGVEVIVFGSGGARRIPDGFDRGEAHGQVVTFCRMVGPVARAHGVTVTVEPLGKCDCNVLTSVAESAALVEEVADANIRLLVDAYHWGRDGDSIEDIVTFGPLLGHVHVATFPERRAPGRDECDLGEFFGAIKRAGYDGRVSVEANLTGEPDELPAALAALKSLAE